MIGILIISSFQCIQKEFLSMLYTVQILAGSNSVWASWMSIDQFCYNQHAWFYLWLSLLNMWQLAGLVTAEHEVVVLGT